MKVQRVINLLALAATLALCPTARAADVTPAEVRAIAKEAYIYGYPLVDSYRIQYAYFIDKDYSHETAETWDGRIEEEGNLGRSDLLLAAGIVRQVGGRALVLNVRVPLRTRSNGVQVDYPAIVSIGWAQ
jgi:hypothetical protein